MQWTQTLKIQYVARVLNITSRSVYRRLKRGELDLDQFNFPEHWTPEPPRPLPEYRPDASQARATAVETGHDGQTVQGMDARPDATGPVSGGVTLSPEELMKAIIELGELRERLKWITAERDLLQREVKLLKAPEEPPEVTVTTEDVTAKSPSILDRARMAWYVLARGVEALPEKSKA